MVKRHHSKEHRDRTTTAKASLENLCQELQQLMGQHHYGQALKKLQQIRRSYPTEYPDKNLPTLGFLWLKLGQYHRTQGQVSGAEEALTRALQEFQEYDAYYDLAKLWLDHDRLEEAHTLLATAFEDGTLPPTLAGCYLKVLALKADYATLSHLRHHQGDRFLAEQLTWLDAILALHQGDRTQALDKFQTLTQPVTPGDHPEAWFLALTHPGPLHPRMAELLELSSANPFAPNPPQPAPKQGRKKATPSKVKAPPPPPSPSDLSPLVVTRYPQHPALQWLANHMITHHRLPLAWNLKMVPQGNSLHPNHQNIALLQQFPQWIEQEEYSKISKNLHKISWEHKPIPPSLYPLFHEILAKEVFSLIDSQHDPEIGVQILQNGLNCFGFHPQFMALLRLCFFVMERHEEARQILQELRQWMIADAKDHPDRWPTPNLEQNLAITWCYEMEELVRSQPNSPQTHEQLGQCLQQAKALAPDYPMVLGFEGLLTSLNGELPQALEYLTLALEEKSFHDVQFYRAAVQIAERLDRPDVFRKLYKKHGVDIHDELSDRQVEMLLECPLWLQCFIQDSYWNFSDAVEVKYSDLQERLGEQFDTSLDGIILQSFVGLIGCFNQLNDDDYSPAQNRINMSAIDVTEVITQDLKKVPPEFDYDFTQAICFYLLRFVNRTPGIRKLIKTQMEKLKTLAYQESPPNFQKIQGYWVAQVIQSAKLAPIETELRAYLNSQPHPAIALAQLQWQVSLVITPTKILRPLLDEFINREKDLPQLLLAKAVSYHPNQRSHKDLLHKAHTLASQLQDAQAFEQLQQETFVTLIRYGGLEYSPLERLYEKMAAFLPDIDSLDDFDLSAHNKLLKHLDDVLEDFSPEDRSQIFNLITNRFSP